MKRYVGILALTLIISTGFASNERLQAVQQQIQQVRQELGNAQNKLQTNQKLLQQSETDAATLDVSLRHTKAQLRTQQHSLSKLQKQESALRKTLNKQQAVLVKHLKTAYILGRQPYIKLLLNEENPDKLQRILTYYRYINHDRLASIKALQTTLSSLQKNQQSIEQHTTQLVVLKRQQSQTHQQLLLAQKNRRLAVSALKKHISSKQQRLQQLLTNKKRLENTIDTIRQQPKVLVKGLAFHRYRGKLSWPTDGKVINLYGKVISHSELHWHGILIDAPSGQSVHAIANGTVVFAKWLAGYGFLMIISHGDGYMSLYGRNQALYKKVGDIVHRGDVIASVGQTGGYDKPALYFAIRHDTVPLNPTSWCH